MIRKLRLVIHNIAKLLTYVNVVRLQLKKRNDTKLLLFDSSQKLKKTAHSIMIRKFEHKDKSNIQRLFDILTGAEILESDLVERKRRTNSINLLDMFQLDIDL